MSVLRSPISERLTACGRNGAAVVAAALLSGLYALYAMAVNPLVVTPSIDASARQIALPPPPPPPENVRMAERFLPSEPWAVQASYQLRTADGFLYFDEWDPDESGEAVRCRPFALIRRPTDPDGDQTPLTIVSESAWLKFASKIDLTHPDPGRVIGGALQGDVRIQGPDGLDVVGRNFFFSEPDLRLWSGNPVEFAWGPHRGRGHGLQVELIGPDDDEPPAGRSLAVSGIRNIRLLRNVAMDLVFDPEHEPGRKPASSENKEPAPVRIRSAGSFDFAVTKHVATFDETVRVYRPTGPDRLDSLQCDRLTLVFEPVEPPPPAATAAPAAPAAPAGGRFEGLNAKLAFRRLRAQGRNVVLISEENDLTAHLTDLIYDAQTRTTALFDGEQVKVKHKASELLAPEITLAHDEQGRVGSVWCRGAGSLHHHDPQTGQLQLAAQWQRQLRKLSDPQGPFDIIELEQQALVRQPERKSGLAADFIRLWLDPQETGTDPPSADHPQPGRLRRMLAVKNVALISPEMQAETERLDVVFEQAPPSFEQAPPSVSPPYQGGAGGGNEASSTSSSPLASSPSAESLPGDRSTPPGSPVVRGGERGGGDDEATPAGKQDGPLHVTAEQIRVRMLPGDRPQEVHVAEVWTEGNVLVTQEHAVDEEPLRLTGDRLHLENRSEHDQMLHLSGTPAHIRDRGVHIEGRDVRMDRGRNLAEVQGAGLLQLPVTSTLEGEKLETPQLLDVWWKEQMTFDGRTAQFFGDVRAVLHDSRMRCQEMQVLLSERFSFSEPARRQDAEIERVVCKDNVDFESKEYADNRLTEVRRGRFAHFTLNQQTGRTDAQGPGWIVFWRRGSGKRAALTPAASVQANRPVTPDAADWEYTRIDFSGRTDGNLKQRFTTFHDEVQIIYGPVERPLETIELDNLPKDAGYMKCQSLRVTQHARSESQNAWIELLASGNVELEGRTFHAQADTISYDESKELYVLRSLGNIKATIRQQKQAGGEYSAGVSAQRFDFIPSRNYLKSSSSTGFNVQD